MLTSNQPSACFALGDDAAAVADQPVDQRDVRAVGLALDVVGLRHIARHEDVGFDAGRGGVGRHGAGRVPAEGIATFWMPSSAHIEMAQERPRALNEPVGIQAFVFHPQMPAPIRSPSGAYGSAVSSLRRASRRDSVADGQHGRIAPHVWRAHPLGLRAAIRCATCSRS